jgi:hypothetical protein
MQLAFLFLTSTNETNDFATLGDYPVRLWSKYVQLSPVIHTDHRKSYQAGLHFSMISWEKRNTRLPSYTMLEMCPETPMEILLNPKVISA